MLLDFQHYLVDDEEEIAYVVEEAAEVTEDTGESLEELMAKMGKL